MEFYYLNRQKEFTDGPSLELGGFLYIARKKPPSQLPIFPVTPKTGTRLGFTAKILHQKGKIPCRVITLAGLVTDIIFQTVSAQQSGRNMCRFLQRSGP